MNQEELDKELFKGIKSKDLVRVNVALKGADVNAQDKDGITALMYAADDGHTEMVKLLLQNGANINAVESFFGDEWTALMLAAAGGHEDVVALLLSFPDIEINIQDKDGDTALIVAVLRNQPSSVKLLLEAGADVQIEAIGGETALSIARNKELSEMWGDTALSVARNKELSEIIELIEAYIAQKEMESSDDRGESITSVMGR